MADDATKPGSMQAMFSCLLLVRLVCAYLAPIMDCDETFNYVEPIHYVTYGSGMQTWEYSPEFALRSYAYVELHALPVRAARFLGLDKVQAFYLLRASLGTISAACEAFFCAAVSQSFGRSVGLLTFGFLAGASGMFHSSVAVLPSSTCMYAVLLGFGAWLRGSWALGLLCGSFAVLMAMAVAVPMFVPMGVAALHPDNLGFVRVVAVALTALVAFALLPSLLDWGYYGTKRPLWAMGNHLLYNFGVGGGGAGADLYGTEPWTFYAKNLVLNFNIVALMAVPSLALTWKRWRLFLALTPMYVTLALFFKMAHKEERFLTMTYPHICLAAAVTLDWILQRTVGSRSAIATFGALVVVACFWCISLSRNAALYHHFKAPLRIYEDFYYSNSSSSFESSSLCIGKEWYRVPSSFFLPEMQAGTLPLLRVNSSFDGQLPQPFGVWPRGLWEVPPHMNDRNLREPSRYHESDAAFWPT